MKVTLEHPTTSGPISLTINGNLPPCGLVEQGAEVELPENYLAHAEACDLIVTHVSGSSPAPLPIPESDPIAEQKAIEESIKLDEDRKATDEKADIL